MVSDGQTVTVTTAKNADADTLAGAGAGQKSSSASSSPSTAAGAGAGAAASSGSQDAAPVAQNTYVLNTNTHKFHDPSCSSVKQMKDKNKKVVTSTRDEVIAQGYDPCKRCNP